MDFETAGTNVMGGVPPATDFQSIIARILGPLMNSIPQTAPSLTPQQGVISPQQLQTMVGGALQPGGAPIPEDAKSAALAKIGIALMQPRMPGQSVAGNIGNAVGGGIDALGAAKKQAQDQAVQQATLASNVAAADVQRRQAETALEILRVEFPMKYAAAKLALEQAAYAGNKAWFDAVQRDIIMNTPGAMQRAAMAPLAKTEAETAQASASAEKSRAEAARVPAQAAVDQAHADYYKALIEKAKIPPNARQTLNVHTTEDGQIITTFGVNGKLYQQFTTPGIADQNKAEKLAREQLKKEAIQKAKDEGRWFPSWGAQEPTGPEVAARVQKLMQPRSVFMDQETWTPVTPEQIGQQTAPAAKPATAPGKGAGSMGVETPDQRREGIAKQIATIESELETATPAERPAKERELKVLQDALTAGNPQTKAVKPGATKQPLPPGVESGDALLAKVRGRGVTVPDDLIDKSPQDLTLEDRRRMAEANMMKSVPPLLAGKSVGQPLQIDEIRGLLKKTKLTPDELLKLESFKDSTELTAVERARILAALRRQGQG